jgi:hypothetical protein
LGKGGEDKEKEEDSSLSRKVRFASSKTVVYLAGTFI